MGVSSFEGADITTRFAPALMCAPASSLVRKRPDHVFRTYFVPPEVRRVFLCRNAYGFAVYDEVAVLYLHGAVKMAVNGVVTEHVSHVINRNEVVDAYHLYAALLDGGTENEAADAPETVDADFNL